MGQVYRWVETEGPQTCRSGCSLDGVLGAFKPLLLFLTFIPENLQQPPASTSAGSVETEVCPPPGDQRPRVEVMAHKCDVSALYLNLGIKGSEQCQIIAE